ncbi:MAG: hypothetical protein EA367_18030 [Leptolyngbya sp. DLM2.Bin15]|nr:MAG: hypothetical protein EA367_18030 [Leptolyngbya sp. DLM2.Bin15]
MKGQTWIFRESLIFQSNADALMLSRVRGMKFSILNNSFLSIGFAILPSFASYPRTPFSLQRLLRRWLTTVDMIPPILAFNA